MLRLRLCGQLAAECDGVTLEMPTGDRPRALIGWLALHPGLHPRTTVAASLWPDNPDANARASLRTAVWSVRQAWGSTADKVFDTSRAALGLRDTDIWVDALHDPPLDRTELLPGIEDEWVLTARAEYRDRQLRLLLDLEVAAGDEGRVGDAVQWARRRCELAPLDEVAHRDLLYRLESAGDHAGAVVAAREFTDRLRAELGVRPSPVTRAAQSRLGAVADLPRPRLFGRAAEVATLRTAWRTAADGGGRVVLLTGEAGIGKTSLLADAVHQAAASGGRSGVGTGSDVGGETPFATWLEIVRALLPTVAPVPATFAWPVELNRLAPELGALLGRADPPIPVAAPELERLRVFESILRLVEWACTDRPALIAIDDAHRADRASLRLTAHIARRLTRLPLLLVLTRRDRPARADLDTLLADLAGRGVPITEVDVGPIGDRDIIALASSLARLDDAGVRRIVAAADGNPLLAVESVRAMAAGGSSPPPNLRTAVRAALGRLTAPGQELARLLAVAGRSLERVELARLGVPDLVTAEQAATDAGLLMRVSGRLGYRHALLREAVYAELDNAADLHDRVADALEPTDRAEVARHLALAGRPAEAACEWQAAALYARSVGALSEALGFLDLAAQAAPQQGEIWLDRQEVLAWMGRREDMEQAWAHALTLLPDSDLPAAWCRRGRQFRTVVCHPTASFEAYATAESLLTDSTPRDVRAQVLIGLAWGHAVAGDATLVDDLLARSAQDLPDRPDPVTASDIGEIRIHGLIRQGRFAECGAFALSWAAEFPAAMRADRIFAVWINAACALACVGDYEQALEFADRAVAGTMGTPVLLISCLAARAHLLARMGRHAEATDTARQQRDLAERLDSPLPAAIAAHDAGLVALAAGRYAEAAELLGQALDSGAPISRPAASLARAEALARAGNPDSAEHQLRAAALEPIGPADQPWALVPRMATIQGLIAAARDNPTLAAARFAEAERGWRALLPVVTDKTTEGFFANLVDLGRPPVVGLVEPGREIALLERERAMLSREMI